MSAQAVSSVAAGTRATYMCRYDCMLHISSGPTSYRYAVEEDSITLLSDVAINIVMNRPRENRRPLEAPVDKWSAR